MPERLSLTEAHYAWDRKLAAWLVHLYTAMGGVLGMFALVLASQGKIREAFLLLIATTWIDGTDGLLARRVRVRDVLPMFNGAEMDNVIDVLTYVWVPVFIMAHQDLLPHRFWIAVPIIAAMYAYGQINMKTPDSFFLGFPTYWNVVALYMFWYQPAPFWAVVMILFPAIMTFIPIRYLYPSRNRVLWKVSWGLAVLWTPLMVYLLLQEQPDTNLVTFSLFYPAYYMLASFYVDWRIRRGEIKARRPKPPIVEDDDEDLEAVQV